MREIDRILDQLKRAQEGPAWHGPALKDSLAGVSAREAAARPIAGGHSIWEIVLHVASCETDVSGTLTGAPPAPAENDWPKIDASDEASWERTRQQLERSNAALRAVVGRLADERLSDIPTRPGGYTMYEILHGIVQHDLYHAGQISLLRKAASE